MEALQQTGANLVYADLEIVDHQSRLMRYFYGIPFDFRILLYGIDYIGQHTVFFCRELLQRIGPLREEFDNAFDYELWLRMAKHGRLVYVPSLLAQIRKHPCAKSIAAAERSWSGPRKYGTNTGNAADYRASCAPNRFSPPSTAGIV